MSTASQRLDVVPEDWQRALAVVAHPDDLEYGTAAAIARWTGQGKQIAYCLVTSGEAGSTPCPRSRRARCARPSNARRPPSSASPRSSSSACPTAYWSTAFPLRRAIAAEIRRHRPEIVIGLSQREVSPGRPTQPSRPRRGRTATIDAVRDAGNRWVFRDLVEEGLQPWPGVHSRAHGRVARPHPRRRRHRYLRPRARIFARASRLPRGPRDASTDFLAVMAREAGERLGVTFAVAFEAISLGF